MNKHLSLLVGLTSIAAMTACAGSFDHQDATIKQAAKQAAVQEERSAADAIGYGRC